MSQTTPLLVPDSARIMFGKTWRDALQQKMSRLRNLCTVETGCTGNSATVDIFGKSEGSDSTGQRFKKVVLGEIPTAIRHIFPREYHHPTGESKWDANTIAPLVAPTGKHSSAHVAAFNRFCDRLILQQLLGDASETLTGGSSPSSVALPADQKIAKDFVSTGSAVDSGLTVDKLLEAISRFEENEVWGQDVEEMGGKLCIATNAKTNKTLLRQIESGLGSKLMSKDYMAPTLDSRGNIKEFLGIQFVRTELVATGTDGGDTVAYCPMWVSTAMQFNVWADMQHTIDIRADLSNALQFLTQARIGAARIEEPGVVQIAAVIG